MAIGRCAINAAGIAKDAETNSEGRKNLTVAVGAKRNPAPRPEADVDLVLEAGTSRHVGLVHNKAFACSYHPPVLPGGCSLISPSAWLFVNSRERDWNDPLPIRLQMSTYTCDPECEAVVNCREHRTETAARR